MYWGRCNTTHCCHFRHRNPRQFRSIAHGLGLECLAEVHNQEELNRVLEVGFQIVGINNRNLKRLMSLLETTAQLASNIPNECVIVSESGIATNQDMKTVRSHGADAVLIGETLMRSSHIAGNHGSTEETSMKQQCKIKFCGIRRLEDVTYMNEFMPDYVGFVFAPSRRQGPPAIAMALGQELHPDIKL